MHIHPGAAQQVARAGEEANLGVFMNSFGGELTDDSVSFPGPDGEIVTYTEGEDQCDGEDGQVQVAYWANASEANDTDPQVFTEDLADIFFQNDGEAYTIAFVPEGGDILVPSTVDQLAELGAVDGGSTVSTPSTVPATTLPGGSTTSVPADPTTTTAPPAG
jgi:hypothetical protein